MYSKEKGQTLVIKRSFYPIPSLCGRGCNRITWNGKRYIHGHNGRIKKDQCWETSNLKNRRRWYL